MVESDVLVCGGGIAGLTAALCLHSEGYDCQVFEAKEDKPTTTSAIQLAPSGVKVLADLGLEALIAERSQAVRRMRMSTSEGRLLADIGVQGKEQYGHDALAMTRRVLHQVLTGKVRALGIPIHYDCRLSSVSQDAERVTAEFDDHGEAQGRFLIGADGIHSSVRRSVFPELRIQKKNRPYFGCGALLPVHYLTAEERTALRLAEGSMNMISGAVGFVGFVGIGTPDDSGAAHFMFWTHIARTHVPADFDPKDLSQVKQVLLDLRGSWCAPIRKMIELIDQGNPDVEAMCGPIESLEPIPSWSSGRVVLIGDAAHGYGPGAQGAALAMEDAALLVRMLKSADDSAGALATVFSTFEAKRRPRVERIGNAAEARNNGRLEGKGFLRRALEPWGTRVVGWWFRNGWRDANYGYRVEDDLVASPG